MLHLLQANVFGNQHYDALVSALDRLGLDRQDVAIRPHTDELVNENGEAAVIDTDHVFCWGSVKMARIGMVQGWTPGSMMNDDHDYRVYAEHYGDEMLNSDCRIIRFGDNFDPPSPIFFARPCGDTKAFSGQHFLKSSWDEFVQHKLENDTSGRLTESTAVQIASLKTIQREFRTWIVKGKVVTASQYKIGDKVVYDRCTEPQVLDYAQRMADVYQPAEAFVLDVCMVDGGMKVVEINCINCAGFYHADFQKLLISVEEAFGGTKA